MSKETRRKFLSQTASGALIAGAVGSTPLLASPRPDTSSKTPELITLIKTEAKKVRKITTGPNDQIYVAADRSILVFDRFGNAIKELSLPRPARSLAVMADGKIFVGQFDHVEVFDKIGNRTASWKSPKAGALVSGLAINSKKQVFVADAGHGKVWRHSIQGELLEELKSAQSIITPAEFFSIAIDSEDNLIVNNPGRHRVETYNNSGKRIKVWGEKSRALSGFSGCCNPISLATLADGRILTAERGQPRVKVFNSLGKYESLLAGPAHFESNAKASAFDQKEGCQSGGFDLAVNSKNQVLILDRVTGFIHQYA